MILSILIGALSNRLRGSEGFPKWVRLLILGGCYAFCCMFSGLSYQTSIISGILLAGSMATGWGAYIGCMGGIKGNWWHERKEWPPIDFLIQWINNERIWGFIGLFLRGFMIGIGPFIACGWGGLIAGCSMPLVYFLGISIEQVFLKRNGWEFSEYIYGAVIFGVTYGILA